MAGKRAVSRAAGLLMLLTVASQLLGLVRDAVIAAVFGAAAALDAYLVALGLMNLVFTLVATAMARAVVPSLTRAFEADDSARANRTVQVALTSAAVVLVSGSVVMYAAVPVVVRVVAPGFDPGTAETAVLLTRVLLVATVVVATSDLLAAAAQADGRFFFSGLEGIGFNLVMIATTLLLGTRLGVPALAVGFVLGSVVRMLLQLPPLRSMGWRLRPRLRWTGTDFREVLHLLPALMVTSAVVNVNTLVDRAVGSAQGEGVITALTFGWRVVTLANTVVVLTVAAAVFPAFSAATDPERRAELRGLVDRALRVVLSLLVPVTTVLVVAAGPIIGLAFGRGAFDQADVALTAVAVTGYALGATVLGLRTIASRASLALGDARSTLVTSVVIMVTNVAGDLTLGVRYGVIGLSVSTSASLALGAVVLLVQLSRRHRAVDLRSLGWTSLRLAVAALLAGGTAAWLGLAERLGGADPSTPWQLLGLLASAGVVAVVYLLVLWLLRSPELGDLTGVLAERLRRRRRPDATP
ncbi:murein biosynthesis integral membrane protein MurJ [Auraticoccus monumenti]|uniref:Putative peptidoglycan lipid II flippase n=1 Tax=Auraticoccus monumenti TaxID=675864 RepID=A0A1G6XD09_9ACTN|nr:murein biosynthesis integral membrane protein MurJ [Auraticoccus monumenti]SDD75185.1 putative peptidoglycan lipid II flippase [Auraticoccus monumenti]